MEYQLEEKKINEILSRANYWNEVNNRNRDSGGSTNISQVLRSELNDVVNSLGFSVLWILEDWAKEVKKIK